jgi:phosphohistidine phosphatase
MKLYLLRHATAESGLGHADADRPLTTFGQAQAKQIATKLDRLDMILSSSARRTVETVENLTEMVPAPAKIKYSHNLYNADKEALLEEIRLVEAENLLIVAHNPGIHRLAFHLAMEENNQHFNNLMQGYAPATLSIFDCPVERWKDLQPAQNKLIDLITSIPEHHARAAS